VDTTDKFSQNENIFVKMANNSPILTKILNYSHFEKI